MWDWFWNHFVVDAKAQINWALAHPLLAIVGLILAYWGWAGVQKAQRTLKGMVKVEARLQDVTNELGEISESLSTTFIEKFPEHIHQLVKLIRRANTSVTILADCLDYGSFRDYNSHEALIEAICEAKKNGKDVKYIIWGDIQPMSRANKYRDLNRRKKGSDFREKVKEFLDNVRSMKAELDPEYDGVLALYNDAGTDWSAPKGAILRLSDLQRKFHLIQAGRFMDAGVDLKSLLRSARRDDLTGTPDEEPSQELFFWIRDDEEAIFIAPNYGEDALAFSTKDPHLVLTLSRMFDRRSSYIGTHQVTASEG